METIEFRQALFWDVNPKNIDPQNNAQYVIERIMEDGWDKEVRWMWNFYDKKLLLKIAMESKNLSPKTSNFWRLMMNAHFKNKISE